jgi:hypothetical protein
MAVSDHVDLQQFMEGVKRRNPGELEFHQAVYEVAMNVFDFIADKEVYHEYQILRRIAEPGLEMSQNSACITWKEDDLQQLLRDIMTDIHDRCVEHGRSENSDYVNYVKGANIAAFIKVADAMLAYGVV